MTLDQVVERLTKYPKYITIGAGNLSKKFKCDREDVYKARQIIKNKKQYSTEYKPSDAGFKQKKTEASILLFDLETSPILAWTFKTRKAFISPVQIERDWSILTYSAKWLNDDTMISGTAKDEEDFDDFNIVSDLWDLFDRADVIIAHNCLRFDRVKLNARFLFHGLTPPSPYKVVDTYQIAKQNFGTTYHRLDFLAKYIGSDGKMEHEGFELWKKCMHGDSESWDKMLAYNEKDVIELEKVYLELRPFDSRHPSISIFNEDPSLACTKCGSKNLEYKKDTYTNTRVFKLYQCQDCHGWSRSRSSENKLKALMAQ